MEQYGNDSQLMDAVAAQFNELNTSPDDPKAGIIVLPIANADVQVLTVHAVNFVAGNTNATWQPPMPKSYPVLHTPTFDGAIPIVVKSNNAPGTYQVVYSIDGGPQQSFNLNWTN